ncbi:MAG: T9SS type A sorting domain-containing protein [Bacteroidetes bacterium]|nr:T9SS type A sorting domain-containing protein [Bacteroidota bacterium]
MKKAIFLFLIIHTSFRISEAQWIRQYPVTLYNHLYDVSFINDKTGWTCGNQGTIIRTTNGGKEWVRQNSGVYKNLYKIFAVDSQVVYCVGFYECILKTTDGGDNWQILRSSTEQTPSYHGLFFINRDTGWLSKNHYILRTTNGGFTFDSVSVKPSYIFDIYFRNYNDGLFCGEGAYMFKTSDAGQSWTQIEIVPKGQGLADFMKLTFVNENTGYTQGRTSNIIFKTTNFGSSWDSLTKVISADECYTISFSSLNTGWCGGTYGNIFKTTDGGFNWRQMDLTQFNGSFINAFWFYNDSIGWAVGGATKILYTDNGGKTNISGSNINISNSFYLNQNYPNPFNSQTLIKYEIRKKGFVILEIYDVTGKKIVSLINQNLNSGQYTTTWKSDNYPSGVYFYKLSIGDFSETKKMILQK